MSHGKNHDAGVIDVRWEGEFTASPQEVWDAFTRHTAGWLWPIDYEPRVGGTERGLTGHGGTVTVWDPRRRFVTLATEADGDNRLDYRLEPHGTRTYLRYHHTCRIDENFEMQLAACRAHTEFYYHSMGEYLRHFSGRDPVYVRDDGREASVNGGTAAVRRALGLPADVAVGDRVLLTPAGLEPIDGVVDYVTRAFLGVRSADALYRFYGRDAWGWPAGIGHHFFAGRVDQAITQQAWSTWLDGVFATEEVGA